MTTVLLDRRTLLLALAAGLALPRRPALAAASIIYRSPGCGCCHKWAEQMNEAGFPVELQDTDDLDAMHAKFGVVESLRGCHVGLVGDYVVEGHVPPADVKRLLAERPKALGLAVPGMPIGSPGMESGDKVEPYAVLLFQADGSSIEFARYG
jgi:hypothetical protein